MEVISYLMAAIYFGGFIFWSKEADKHPLAPWNEIGSSAYVWVVNPSYDTLSLYVKAPEVDSAVRFLGSIAPCAEGMYRLPYLDTEVEINLVSLSQEFVQVVKPMKPGVYTLDYGKGQQAETVECVS